MKTFVVTLRLTLATEDADEPEHWDWERLLQLNEDGPMTEHSEREACELVTCMEVCHVGRAYEADDPRHVQ